MAQGGVSPSIPRADFSAGGSGTGASLPFSRDDTPGAGDVLVHFTVCTADEETIRRVTATIERQMRGQRVGERGIAVIITDDSVDMATTTKQIIAAQITPLVAAALGVPQSMGR